jgi:ribosomal protein S18 acetylase RimI-like enzyme
LGKEISTGTARVDEARRILDLQYLCFRSQAAIYDDWAMPPLTQTLGELIQEYDHKKILVARLGDEVIGSVRARMDGKACHIDRLMVHPERQGDGLGERLMREIEADFPEADSFELFTGHRSESNLRLYCRLGYEAYREEVESDRVTLIHMRKPAPGRRRSTAG